MQPTVGSGTPLPRAERLFHLALRNQIDDAVQLVRGGAWRAACGVLCVAQARLTGCCAATQALASGLERVVPLLPHFACQRAVFAPLLRTVVDRIKQVKPGNADEELLPLYSLLAGLRAPEVTDRLRYEQSLWPPASVAAAGDDGDAAAEADEADGGERLDWLLVLAFVLWYSGDVDASFAASQSSVHDVLKAVLQDVQGDKRAGDRDTACRAIYGAADAEVTVRDSLLSLLQLYVQLGRQSADTGARVAALVEQVLDEDGQCRGRMAGALDAAVRWVLMRVLIDCGVVPTAVSALSQACSRVTVAATAQLVDAGLWQEALVVAMSHESERARRAAVQTVLERWVAHECRAADAAASTSASAAADAAAAEPRTTRPGRRAGVGASGMDGVAGFGHGAGSDGYDSLDEDAFDDRAAAAQAPAGGDEDEWIADDTSARGGRASAALAARRWTSVLSHCAGVHGVAVAWQCVVAIASCCAARGWRVLTTALWLASGIDGATLSAHLGVDATGRAHAAAGRTVPRGTASSSVRVLLTVVGEAVGAVGARLYASSSNAATSSAGASTFHVRRTFGIDAVPGVFAACVPFVREELLARHITDYVQTCFAGGLLAENVLPASARAGASAAVPSAARASLEPLWLQLLRVWDARNPAGLPGSLRPWLVLRTCVDVDVARAGAGAHRDVARIIQVLADLPSELSVAQRVCVDLLGRWLHQHVHPRDARPWQTAFASQATGSTAAPLYQQEALHAGLRRDLLHVAVDDLLAGLC